MTSTTLSQKQLNFARFSILCVDVITLPLKDILDIFVKPADLDKKIKACPPLLTGIYKLDPDQKKKCCYNSSNTPDYSTFDITLLYKLIRYLCPSLEPPNKWGTKPTVNDVSIGDDIERIRKLRNKRFAHTERGEISDDDFIKRWSDAKRIIQRCQHFTTSRGCNTDYNQMIVDLEKRTLTFDEYISNIECSGAICVSGDTEVLCGNTGRFVAEISTEQDVYWPLNWDRVDGLVREQIDIENKKYEGSDTRTLIINNVCMEDKGGYQAVISRKPDVKILSNRVYLRPKGDRPCLEELNATTNNGEIYIQYVFNVSDNSPTVNDIKWTKDESFLELSSKKYRGGGLADNCLTILRPGEDDKGLYTCTVSNAVGPVSKSIKLDIPSAEILSTTNLKVIFGSDTKLNCSVSGYPSANKVEWQSSLDGTTFCPTDIDEDKYFGSSSDPCSPFLLVRNATLYDQQYYRVIVTNEIGKYASNKHFLQVTGGKPNMSEVTCTFKGHSVKLNCGVFLYDESPALSDVYWIKNGMKIEIEKNNGKYSGMDINDPSLTINRVNHNDAGDYQLTAVNAVGETESEVIVLGVPKVHLEKCDKKEDGSLSFTMTIKSVPVPHAVQWIMKEHGSESVQPINVNVAEYRGTTNTFPHPVLVIKHLERLENCSFEIEVKNRIGEAKARIPGEINQQIAKRKKSTLGKFHIDGGSRVPFSKLLNELARKFPKEKVNQLKYLIRVSCNIKEVKELDQAENAADCFIILWKEELITTSNVIAMQFLLQETECEDLERKCVVFAKKQNAIYYYEKPPENGWRNVRFHVDAIIHHFSTDEETKIKETVANIVGCSIEDIRVHGYLNGMSFFIVLAIKDIYIEKLLNIKEHDKDKLRKLNIDYFKDDFKTISLKRTTGVKDEPSIMFDHEKGSSEPSKKCSIADKSQNKLEPAEQIKWHMVNVKIGRRERLSLNATSTCTSTSLDQLYCDVTFRVGMAGKEIKAHKYVLASRSNVFEAMLFGRLSETSDVIDVPDIEAETFDAMLRFLYFEEAEINENSVIGIIYAAEKYGITDLLRKCQVFLETHITEDNICIILENALRYNMDGLFQKCQNVIYESLFVSRKVFESQSFLDLSKHCLCELVQSDRLPLDEKAIFDSLLHWAKEQCIKAEKDPMDPSELRRMLGDLLYHVRFPLMTSAFFKEDIVPMKILSDEEVNEISDHFIEQRTQSTVFKTKQRNMVMSIYRIHRESTPTLDWNSNGEMDAIDFEANKAFQLHGILLFGSSGSYIYVVEVRISSISDGNRYLLHIPKITVTGKDQIFKIKFDKPCQINPNERYQISVRMKGPTSFCGDFCESYTNGDFIIQFFDSSYTGTGTCKSFGQIPGLVCFVPK